MVWSQQSLDWPDHPAGFGSGMVLHSCLKLAWERLAIILPCWSEVGALAVPEGRYVLGQGSSLKQRKRVDSRESSDSYFLYQPQQMGYSLAHYKVNNLFILIKIALFFIWISLLFIQGTLNSYSGIICV